MVCCQWSELMTISAWDGLAIGALVGVVSGVSLILILNYAQKASNRWHIVTAIIVEILGLPSFWGGVWRGADWASGSMLQVPDRQALIGWYWIGVVIFFVLVAGRKIIRLVMES